MRENIILNDGWKSWYTPHLGVNAPMPEQVPERAMSAEVPGLAQTDLMREGLLPDLYHGDNVDHAVWMEDKDWWYERSFATPATAAGRRATLVFHGLDTFATVWLNGREIGRCENMFIRHEFDITGHLVESGNNRLVVRLASPRYSIRVDLGHQPLVRVPERLFCRKAQMSFGWDIAPRILTVGIWRPVELVLTDTARLENVWIRALRLERTRAVVRVQCSVEWLVHRDGVAHLHGTVYGHHHPTCTK
jgi:beta-mannosidase